MKPELALAISPTVRSDDRGATLRLTQRIFLYPNELYRVPATYRQVRAQQGIAHISHGGRDLIVMPGESIALAQIADVALVSPLRNGVLVLELFV